MFFLLIYQNEVYHYIKRRKQHETVPFDSTTSQKSDFMSQTSVDSNVS